MDEERKRVLTAGVHLGDIALALASVAHELPSYVRDLDFNTLMPEGGEGDAVVREVEQVLAEQPESEDLPEPLVRMVLERALTKGKFLSAIRCLEILGEKDDYVEAYLSDARAAIEKDDFPQAAKALVTASNLDLEDGMPLFHYSGGSLHEKCTSAPEGCVTNLDGDDAVLVGLKYLLGSTRGGDAVEAMSGQVRRALLPHVALERDPDAVKFYRDYRQAHEDLQETQGGAVARLREDLKHVQAEVAGFADRIGRISARGDEMRDSVERLRRTANSLKEEFSGVEDLLDSWQFKRLRDRLEHLVGSRDELEKADQYLSGIGPSEGEAPRAVLNLIADLEEKGVLESVDEIEQKLASTQVTMLGRQAHSQEHWQFLREIAFKYPVSPLMCCLRKMNDRWLVVPCWESDIVAILRDHFSRLVEMAPDQAGA